MKKICNSVSKEKIQNYIGLVLLLATLTVVLLRILRCGLTWDESVTYLRYSRTLIYSDTLKDSLNYLLPGSLANNQLLNTTLISLSEMISNSSYNEFWIRFPSLVSYMIYGIVAYILLLKKQIYFLTFMLLILNVYVNEFFSFARGYSISCALVFLAVYMIFYQIENSNRKIIIGGYILIFAESANTIVLLTTLSILIMVCVRLLKKKQFISFIKQNIAHVIIISFGNLIMVIWHMYISSVDTGLYVNHDVSFGSIFNELIKMYLPKMEGISIAYFVIFIFALVWICNPNKSTFISMFFLYVIVSVMLGKIFAEGIPCGRTLIPNFPIFVLAINESIEFILGRLHIKKVTGIILNTIASIILIITFVVNVRILDPIDWPVYNGSVI